MLVERSDIWSSDFCGRRWNLDGKSRHPQRSTFPARRIERGKKTFRKPTFGQRHLGNRQLVKQ